MFLISGVGRVEEEVDMLQGETRYAVDQSWSRGPSDARHNWRMQSTFLFVSSTIEAVDRNEVNDTLYQEDY